MICHSSSYKQVALRVYILSLSQKEANGTCIKLFWIFQIEEI